MTALQPIDGKSGAAFDRADGRFVKRISRATDWAMRVTGDRVLRPYVAWRAGLLDQLPTGIDHAVLSMTVSGAGEDAELEIVMRDVSPFLVPPGSDPIPADWHAGFIAHMATLAAAFWNWSDDLGLTTMRDRVLCFAPATIAPELAAAVVPPPVAAAAVGWHRLAEVAPRLSTMARRIHADPCLLTTPLAATPTTLLHGDWKLGNLGLHPDGRTVLLDWAFPGAGPALWDLCWYLALNRERIPESKEDTVERDRTALVSHGIATAGWWQPQLDLCTIAIMATFGWEKALGDAYELAWWDAAVAAAVERQGIVL